MKKLIKKRWAKHYHKQHKYRYINIAIDLVLMLIITTLIATNIYIPVNSGKVLGIYDDYLKYANEDDNIDNQDKTDNTNDTDNDIATSTDNDVINEPVIIKTTDVKLSSFARYYTGDGEQLGVGPIPPRVGKTTSYWIFISVDNFIHNLDNAKITATLPENVIFTGKSSVAYGDNINVDNQELSWIIGDLDSKNDQIIAAAFEISITPTIDSVDQTVNLLKNVSFSAIDSITKVNINKINSNITTKTNDDNGVVIE
jgi:hypothetical protein